VKVKFEKFLKNEKIENRPYLKEFDKFYNPPYLFYILHEPRINSQVALRMAWMYSYASSNNL
jgi:hypothetical protein